MKTFSQPEPLTEAEFDRLGTSLNPGKGILQSEVRSRVKSAPGPQLSCNGQGWVYRKCVRQFVVQLCAALDR
jgi:hypothetical protein